MVVVEIDLAVFYAIERRKHDMMVSLPSPASSF